jgi:heat shock protein HslJ
MMACEPDVMDQEVTFHQVLGAATSMEVAGGRLTLSTDDGRELIFEPATG